MKESKTVNQVLITNDYSLFKYIKGNMPVYPAHVNRIKRSIQTKDAKTPIYVNKKMEIIDGQHTFCAREALGAPIYYVIMTNLGLGDIQRLNSNSKNWNPRDYALSFANEGLVDYQMYLLFRKQWGFGHQESMMMLADSKKKQYHEFKLKAFKVKDVELANGRANKITILGRYYKGYKRRSFVYAMYNLFKLADFEFEILSRKFKKNSGSFFDQISTEAYTIALVEMYNKFTPNEKKLPKNL